MRLHHPPIMGIADMFCIMIICKLNVEVLHIPCFMTPWDGSCRILYIIQQISPHGGLACLAHVCCLIPLLGGHLELP